MLRMSAPPVPWHKTEADRASIARRTREMLEEFYGKGNVPMWMDTMDDNLAVGVSIRTTIKTPPY